MDWTRILDYGLTGIMLAGGATFFYTKVWTLAEKIAEGHLTFLKETNKRQEEFKITQVEHTVILNGLIQVMQEVKMVIKILSDKHCSNQENRHSNTED